MENTSPEKPVSALALFLINREEDSQGSLAENVVLPDECGDSLWEEVLLQQDAALKSDFKNNDLVTGKPDTAQVRNATNEE